MPAMEGPGRISGPRICLHSLQKSAPVRETGAERCTL